MAIKKKILVINPNTNKEMTKSIEAAALSCKYDTTEIVAVTNTCGPLSIEGFFDEVLSTQSLLEILVREEANYDAFVIACYSSHPGIIAGREVISKPVVGVFEASCLLACLIGNKFGVVTTSARWKPLLEEGIHQLGLESRCAVVKSSGLAVLDLESKSPQEVKQTIFEVGKDAVENYGAEVICLGCAGMAGLAEQLERELKVPVIDPICAAVKMAESLIYQGLYTSKVGAYRPIEPRDCQNLPNDLAKVYR